MIVNITYLIYLEKTQNHITVFRKRDEPDIKKYFSASTYALGLVGIGLTIEGKITSFSREESGPDYCMVVAGIIPEKYFSFLSNDGRKNFLEGIKKAMCKNGWIVK
jgi:hypothetical protein